MQIGYKPNFTMVGRLYVVKILVESEKTAGTGDVNKIILGHIMRKNNEHSHTAMHELMVLMKYMADHNVAHTQELAELAV